tara:strand:+ start:1741 stop:8097 length:6357 start_codon:yes stop_codon:yes gene_type:complete
MAEIKNDFSQGKMNKDLDERLVPNGQYRDAMNIQISTSEGSDVGTVQNILGNSLADDLILDQNSTCVGAVSDEKNDCFYWFIKGPVYSDLNVGVNKDSIYKYRQGVVTPVFVDVHEVIATYVGHDDLNNTITIFDQDAKSVSVGMIAQFLDNFNQTCHWNDNPIVSISRSQGPSNDLTILTLKNNVNLGVLISQVTQTALYKFVKKDSNLTCPGSGIDTISKSLDFQLNKIITGINILEDLLFWTDNNSEPKQINIKNCIENTDPNGNTSTMLPNSSEPMTVDHITVIKKSPLLAPILEMSSGKRSGLTSGITNIDFDGKVVGQFFDALIQAQSLEFNWNVDDVVIFQSYEINQPLTPLFDFEIKARLDTVYSNVIGQSSADFQFEIISIDSATPTGLDSVTGLAPSFVADLYQPTEKLFEFKFPRFAIRYKYTDNKYSCIGPFSEIAFLPGNFDYHPTKGYNLGMTNQLTSLYIKEFVAIDIPEDVIGIDILYKESNSSNIYILDTIKPDDDFLTENPYSNTYNAWNYPNNTYETTIPGKYEVKAESIYATLPSNQTIRPWDNVPRKALAQEITGNRIVYGNYLQNYDLISTHPKFNVNIQEFSYDLSAKTPQKSIKSLRDYQLGVVYFDKYGRQTPILTSNSASVKIPKLQANKSSQFKVKLNSSPPSFATHYKFYVKESSNEYYNLAMDRWYEAEDNNIWIAFSSSDRNKVDEDMFLILKKGNDSDDLVEDSARYKIIAIKNQAPDSLKLNKLPQGLEYHNNSSNDVFGQDIGKFPLQSRDYFSVNADVFFNSSLDNIYKALENNLNDELWVRFEQSGNAKTTKDYRVTNISATTDADGVVPGSMLEFKVEKQFESDITFIYDEVNGQIENATAIVFEKRKLENSAKFDGKFFVKINKDQVIKSNIDKKIDEDTKYRVVSSKKIYYMSPDHMTLHSDSNDNKANWHTNGLTWANTGRNTGQVPNTNVLSDFFYKFTGFARTAGDLSIDNRRAHNATPTTNTFEDIWYVDGFQSTIDGKFVGASDTSGTFSSQDHTDSTSSPNTGFETRGIGVTNYTNVSRIEIGFTGLEPDPDNFHHARGGFGNVHASFGAYYEQSDNNNNPGPYDYYRGDQHRLGWGIGNSSIYNVGEGQINSNYAEESRFINALVPGTKIRWAEDPNGTVYTITSIDDSYKLRYDYRVTHTYNTESRRPENFSRNWRLWLDKKMQWDPTAPNDGQLAMNGFSPNTDPFAEFAEDGSTGSGNDAAIIRDGISKAQGYTIEIIENIIDDEEVPENPAVWETEPKQETDINIYYEASNAYPINLNRKNIHHYIKPGMAVKIAPWIPTYGTGQSQLGVSDGVTGSGLSQRCTVDMVNVDGTILLASQSGFFVDLFLQLQNPDNNNEPDILMFSDDETTIQFKVSKNHINTGVISIDFDFHNTATTELPWFNCYSFRNGVESNRIKDAFNNIIIDKGAKVSTTLEGNLYKEERRTSGLIYSGIYNSTSGTNDLNQFIQGEKITKDLNPTYGSIQKLFSRNTDLITFCEDKVVKVLANKDAVFNADGNPQLTANQNVLGQTIPFVGDYGISKNPESFASQSYRAYFTDKQRGAILRLSRDGLTPISEYGMKTWFFDNLKDTKYLIGGYDTRKQEYNLTLKYNNLIDSYNTTNKTLSYKEDVKGWVSFKSFIPENSISVANEYFTFKKGHAYKHHDKSVDRNTFYLDVANAGFKPSWVEVLFNQEPQTIKSFSALNYEGSKGQTLDLYARDNFKNRTTSTGWYAGITTNEETNGTAFNFTEMQDEWFSPIKGNATILNTENFTVQGLGILSSFLVTGNPIGPVLPPFTPSGNPVVTIDNNPIYTSQISYNITDPLSPYLDPPSYFDYDITIPSQPNVTGNNVPYSNNWDLFITLTSDGISEGVFTFYWYDAILNAIIHQQTSAVSFYATLGCMDSSGDSSNYNALANVSDGSCLYDLTHLYTPPILRIYKEFIQTLGPVNEWVFYIQTQSASAFGALVNEPYVYEFQYGIDSGSQSLPDWTSNGFSSNPDDMNNGNGIGGGGVWLDASAILNGINKFIQPITEGETSPFNFNLQQPSSNITGAELYTPTGTYTWFGFRLKCTDTVNGRVTFSNIVSIYIN